MLFLMRRFLSLLAGIGIVAGIWSGLGIIEERSRRAGLPEGWDHLDPPGEVCALLQDPLKPERLWTGGRDGLILVDMKERRVISPLSHQPRFERVWALEYEDSGNIWIGAENGLACYRVPTGVWLSAGEGAPATPVHCLLYSKRQRLWAGGPGGLYVLKAHHWSKVNIPAELQLPSIDVLFEEASGCLWAGSSAAPDGGLLSLEGGRWLRHPVGPEIPHPSVNMITSDSRGRLWFATGFANHGGAAFLQNGRWHQWGIKNGLAGEKVRSIFEDSFMRIWFGSEYDGLAIWSPQGGWIRIRPGAGLGGREIKVVIEEQPGVYWLGTDRGLSRLVLPPTRSKTE